MAGISPYPLDIAPSTNTGTGGSANPMKTGLANITADGTKDTFTFPHTLGATPSYACITPKNSNAAGEYSLNWDAVNLTVEYMLAPDPGSVLIGWVVTG